MRNDSPNSNREFIVSILSTQGSKTISELCRLTNLSRPSVYLHLEILERKGLIKREKDPKKKGAPVTISLIHKDVEKEQVQKEVLKLLEMMKDKPLRQHELSLEQRKKMTPRALLEAGIHGYFHRPFEITKKGKSFLEKHGGKE